MEKSTTQISNPNVKRPSLRLTTEYDSDSQLFFNKISSKLFDGIAKLKLSFQNDHNGGISFPQMEFLTKHFSLLYDLESKNALLSGNFDVNKRLQVKATHDVKRQQGVVSMVTNLNEAYKLEVSSTVPSIGLPRACLKFPSGEVSVEEKPDEEKQNEDVKKELSLNGIFKGQLMNGVCTAIYSDNILNLRYAYKDEELSLIPSISLPSNAISVAFKRRFNPSNKLSYWYHFDSNEWSTVYKHTFSKDLKFKSGYDSEPKLGWASLWVGDESGSAKAAPMKMKAQVMLQVPQDDIRKTTIMFRIKKRWDI